ncbi:polysaccharide pyruvyl transferase CsaB [Anaerobacterium chartisolvens]|uniref:Polysaccharide pyruvyl transferase CsaB n=1 Tax=Anaerobacterium chartisolvens TaxID=1297424 RepID=A0A369ASQ7_9FIRM|nr:polysaccharide pyruvyl transferase CsaB [Anaerobacterium chartisolvens]RCX12379.1 polysaccharide pyruvyl transferase CsaB [Anaerobacterium chartisolvens]
MKVIHLTGGGDIGGAKTHVVSLIKNLGKNIDVKLISLRAGDFADEARAAGIDTQVVYSGNIILDILRVIKIINSGNYDIIHSHGAKANMFAVISKIFTGLPIVTTVHSDYRLDYMHSIPKKYSFGVINSIALRLIDNYICVSSDLREKLIDRGFMPNKLFTIPNGIDFNIDVKIHGREEFAKKYNVPLQSGDVVVGILARLTPVKGIGTFIKAAGVVADKNPSVKFLIAGDGEDRSSLEQMAASLGLQDNVYFLGWVSEIFEFLSVIDINVLSSLSEGFPYSILEGALLKKATISTNVGGIPDLIESGINGYLFNPGDHESLGRHIIELSDNTSKRLEIGDMLYSKAKLHYSLDSMRKTQLEIYGTLLARSRSRHLYDIILSGYYGFKNSGDDAILMAIINDIRTYKKDVKIMVLSHNPMETKKSHNVDSTNRLNIISITKAMRRSKLFINGGGNLMQDDTSTRSLIYYLGATWLAKKMGAKVMVYANGIGPINKSFNRKLTRIVLNQVDVITLREEFSRREVSNLGINSPEILVTADPSLTVVPISSKNADDILSAEGIDLSHSFIGFSARSCENSSVYDHTVIARAADYVIDRYGSIPVFIPMQPSDTEIIRRIVSQMKGKGYILTGQYQVSEILGIISRMEMLIGMRLHSLIYAANLGIPVIGLVYDPKVEAFLEYFHQASAGSIEDLNYDRLVVIIDDVWLNKSKIKGQLNKITSQLKEKALQNAQIAVRLIEEKEG